MCFYGREIKLILNCQFVFKVHGGIKSFSSRLCLILRVFSLLSLIDRGRRSAECENMRRVKLTYVIFRSRFTKCIILKTSAKQTDLVSIRINDALNCVAKVTDRALI